VKRALTILIAALIALCANAGNYPDRVDYLWVTVPDHADWLYRTGENATVEIQFYKYGIPRDCTVEYKLADDMLEPDKSGSLVLKGGRGKLNMGSRRTPGFRDLQLSTEVDGVKYEHHIKLGFSVDKIEPFTREPKDFSEYWDNTIKEAEQFPLTYTRELAPEYCTDKIDCWLVRLMLNRSQSVYAYLFFPKNAQKGSCPAVLCPPGAGIKTIKEPLRHKYYAEAGCIRMEMEIHGLDPRIPSETFSEITAAFNGKENGYLSNGIEDRDRYYMRRVYISLVRAIDLLTSLPEWDGKNVVVQGGSQGGALSLVAAGLDRRVTLCIANHPALSDMAGYSEKGRTGGYPHFNRIPGFFTDNIIRNLAYYDVVNFARHISCKVRMTWGYNDNTCPPTTSYAVWNSLNCPKEALVTPINEHWTSEATERGHLDWMLNNLK
jgi:cephalosporin-C deacetylase-like acetyl esterase